MEKTIGGLDVTRHQKLEKNASQKSLTRKRSMKKIVKVEESERGSCKAEKKDNEEIKKAN